MRHCLSQRLINLITFVWEAHGEPPAALRFFDIHKYAGKPCAFQVPKPVSEQTYPCQSVKGEGIGWLLSGLGFRWRAWLQTSGFPPARE